MDMAAAGRIPRRALKMQSAGCHGKRAKEHGGHPALGGEAWGQAARPTDAAARRARQQCRPARAPGRPQAPAAACLSHPLPLEHPPTSPLVRASLLVGTASDGLGPEGQAFRLWREAGVPPLTAGAHPDLLTLTRGHLPPSACVRAPPTACVPPGSADRLGAQVWAASLPGAPTRRVLST